jgi:hypothetical protein
VDGIIASARKREGEKSQNRAEPRAESRAKPKTEQLDLVRKK